jgi:AraC-like DNA-binding protein
VDSADVATILPDGCVEIVLSFGDPLKWGTPDATMRRMIVGQAEGPLHVAHAGRVDMVGIRLRPAAARVFVPEPQDELANGVFALDTVAPELDAIFRSLTPDTPLHDRLLEIDSLLSDHVRRAPPLDPLLEAAINAIEASGGRLPVATLARRLGVGLRRLERRFTRDVGLPPKRWARIVRFQCAVEQLASAPHINLSALAADLGFADQPHFTREFTALAGVPPRDAWWL